MPAPPILPLLAGADRRSIGASPVAASLVLQDPSLLPELIDGLQEADTRVRMRAADALEKLARERPALLRPYRARIIEVARRTDQSEVQWHMAQLFTRLELTPPQRTIARRVCRGYLRSGSSIVQTMALDALVRLAPSTTAGRAQVHKLLDAGQNSPFPAVRARARRLRTELAKR